MWETKIERVAGGGVKRAIEQNRDRLSECYERTNQKKRKERETKKCETWLNFISYLAVYKCRQNGILNANFATSWY